MLDVNETVILTIARSGRWLVPSAIAASCGLPVATVRTVLQALATNKTSPEELDEIRKLLATKSGGSR